MNCAEARWKSSKHALERVMKMNKPAKPISFEDAYGLQLIASNPYGVDREFILNHLGSEAKRIGSSIIKKDNSNKSTKSSSKRHVKAARKK
jgi:hypothetical protein